VSGDRWSPGSGPGAGADCHSCYGCAVTTSVIVLALAVFVACSVEMVEALTIVVAAGVTRGWRSALEGVAAAIVVLAVVVAALGPALVHLVPLSALRIVIGFVLLVFGLQWLRKAILRACGLKAKHDEDAIYARKVAELRQGGGTEVPSGRRRDATAFTVAFKGVFLEGTEVVIIVLTLGTTAHHLGVAVLAAAAAVVVIGGIGAAVTRQLSQVPENAMKMGVGLMLVSFGTFWSGEGLGLHWPGADLAIPVLVGVYGLAAFVLTRRLALRPGGQATSTRSGAHDVRPA
jgi:uncharacterized membrane protein